MIFENFFSYLQEMIDDNEGLVTVDMDIHINNPFYVRKDDLIIDGNNFAVNAHGKTRIFEVTGDNIVLKNFIFKNGNAFDSRIEDMGYGGVIRNEGHLILENCLFLNNVAEYDGNDIINYGKLDIINCVFSQNNSNSSIFNLGEVRISQSQFESIEPLISGGHVGIIED